MVAIDLVGGGVKVTARRVVFVVGDDARPRLPPSIDPSRLLRRLKAGQLDESPVHISADVLEVQQSRDGHDAAYVCRGGVVLTRGQQLRATAPTLTVDARTHEASSGPCKLQWAPARSLPQGWAAAMVARGLTRSRAAAASCRIDLRTGDWTCHDVDARLQRSWSKGAAAAPAAAFVHADRLALSFAGAAGLRVSGDGSEWLPGPSHGNPPLGASRLQVLTRGKEALDSLRQARRTALETTLSRRAAPSATPAPPLPPPAPSLSAPSSLASPPRRVRSLCARLSPSARSVALRLPIPMPELRAASGVAPRVRLSASARVRLPVATRSTTSASHATVRARWDARRGASSSLTVRSLRDTTTATTTAPRATSRAETPSDALATTVMARELVLGRYASSRAASLGPLPSSISVPATPIPTSMPASPRSTGPRSSTTSPHGPAEARSGPLDRFMWRVRLPVGPRNAQLASLSCTHAMQEFTRIRGCLTSRVTTLPNGWNVPFRSSCGASLDLVRSVGPAAPPEGRAAVWVGGQGRPHPTVRTCSKLKLVQQVGQRDPGTWLVLQQDVRLPGGCMLRCQGAAGFLGEAMPRFGFDLQLPSQFGHLKLKWRA